MNNRTIILLCLIILVAGVTNWLLDQTVVEPEPPEPAGNEPDMYMLGARMTQFDEDGALQHRLRATRFTHFPVTEAITLQDPDLNLFSSEAGPWNIAAKNGRLLPASEQHDQTVELWEHVVGVRETADGDFTNIQTESLSVFPDRQYAETDQKVHIDSSSGRTTAAAMKAWFEPGRFQFFSTRAQKVHTVLVPLAESAAAGQTGGTPGP